jgi:hypothetical protein
MTRYFVLGASHTGKSPMARRLARELGIAHVGASAWVRETFPEPPLPDDAPADVRAAFVDRITQFALAELRRDPAVSIASLRRRTVPGAPCVIEGMRNPFDFVATFDPRTDHAVFLEHTAGAPPTSFERGLAVIRAYLDWLADTTLLERDRVRTYRFATFGTIGQPAPDTLEGAIVDAIATLPRPAEPVVTAAPARVHAAIPPIRTHVRAEYLYGMDPARAGELRPCTAFSLSSYPGNAPTFQILLGDGAVFSYIPASALVDPFRDPLRTPSGSAARPGEAGPCDPTRSGEPLELADLVYHDCRSLEICVNRFEALAGPVLCFFKRTKRWLAGEYLFTVDWYTGNDLLHGIALANGQYALLPNHKVKFGDHPPGFEPYKKIRREWVVG